MCFKNASDCCIILIKNRIHNRRYYSVTIDTVRVANGTVDGAVKAVVVLQ